MARIEQISDLATAKQAGILLEKENERLHKRLQELAKENAELRGEDGAQQLQLEIARLQQQMQRLQKELFGRSSERRGKNGKGGGKQKGKKKGHGPRKQLQLRIEECEHKLDEAEQVCELCGRQLNEWEGQSEDSEEITSVKREFVILKHKRKKYRCNCGASPVTAPGPLKLMPGGRYSIELAVDVAVDKYLDHLPLERQVQIMKRQGFLVSSQTLWDQLQRLAQVLGPCYEALGRYVQGKAWLNVDETPWPFLQKPNKKWWVWAASSYDAVYYHFDPTRSTDAAEKLLGDFKGTLVVDGYISYKSLLKRRPGIVLSFCWSHARRKCLDAEKYYPDECKEILELIDDLFWVERQLPNWERIDGEDRERSLLIIKDARQIHSAAIVEEIKQWIFEQRPQPGSNLEGAVNYISERWKGLVRFLDDPRIPLSNNRAERELRPCVLGRKNHYGSRSVRGTEVAALFYGLLESAKLAGVDPNAYLLAAAKTILTDPAAVLLPHEFAAQNPALQTEI